MPLDLLPKVLLLLWCDRLSVELPSRCDPLALHKEDVDDVLGVDKEGTDCLEGDYHFVLVVQSDQTLV